MFHDLPIPKVRSVEIERNSTDGIQKVKAQLCIENEIMNNRLKVFHKQQMAFINMDEFNSIGEVILNIEDDDISDFSDYEDSDFVHYLPRCLPPCC